MTLSRTGRRSGFTLIELVVAIAIVGILSAVAIPQLLDLRDLSLDAAFRRVRGDLLLARNLAMTQHRNVGIYFDTATNTYTCYDMENTPWTVMIHPSTRETFTVRLNQGIYQGVTIKSAAGNRWQSKSGGYAGILFDRIGCPYPVNLDQAPADAGNFGVRLTNGNRDSDYISVACPSGTVD